MNFHPRPLPVFANHTKEWCAWRRQAALRLYQGLLGTDFTEDLKKIDIPVLLMHGDDDQIVPIGASALEGHRLLKNSTLKVYPSFPHGMATTHAEIINKDLLEFFRS